MPKKSYDTNPNKLLLNIDEYVTLLISKNKIIIWNKSDNLNKFVLFIPNQRLLNFLETLVPYFNYANVPFVVNSIPWSTQAQSPWHPPLTPPPTWIFRLMWSPLVRRHLFWPFKVYISVIITYIDGSRAVVV